MLHDSLAGCRLSLLALLGAALAIPTAVHAQEAQASDASMTDTFSDTMFAV